MQTGNTLQAAQELVSSIPGAEIVGTFSIFEILSFKGAQKLEHKHVSAIKIESLRAHEEKRNVKQKQFQMKKVVQQPVASKEPVRRVLN